MTPRTPIDWKERAAKYAATVVGDIPPHVIYTKLSCEGVAAMTKAVYLAGVREGMRVSAEVGSKAAWTHFHFGAKDLPSHECTKTDWGFADAVSEAIRAAMPDATRPETP